MPKYVLIVGLTRFLCFTFGDNSVRTNEDSPILSAKDFSFWQYTVYADIRQGSHAWKHKLTVGWLKAFNFRCP